MILALLNRARKTFSKDQENAVKIHLTRNVINDVAIKMANLNHRSLHLRIIYTVVITKRKTLATDVYTSGACLNVAFNKKQETIFPSTITQKQKILEDFSSTQSIFFLRNIFITMYSSILLAWNNIQLRWTSLHYTFEHAMIYFPFKCIKIFN